MPTPARAILHAADTLSDALSRLRFKAPVTHVYAPLVYARKAHAQYVERYAQASCEVMLLGMNPGPFGMAQTGVPFGEVAHVGDWLGIDAPIGAPPTPHPKRPVLGLSCPRNEVSGARLWGWAKRRFQTPDRFFQRFFVANYCPLLFLEVSGRNRTPNKLPKAERQPLLAACDEALVRTVDALQPSLVVGVGVFAETQARRALAGSSVRIGRILHPSPASPKANRGWAAQAEADLGALGVALA